MASRKYDPAWPLPKVLETVGVGRSTLWNMVRAGTFPAPIRLTAGKKGRVGWRASEVQGWLDKRPSATYPTRPAA